jgi:hypothetical protein
MAAAVVAGRVLDAAGAPVAGATISFVSAPGPVPDIAGLSAPDGRFVLDAPRPGRYVIAAHDAEGEGAEVAVDVGDVPPAEVEIRLGR